VILELQMTGDGGQRELVREMEPRFHGLERNEAVLDLLPDARCARAAMPDPLPGFSSGAAPQLVIPVALGSVMRV